MKKRYRVRITLSGYLLIGLTLVVALAGVNTGNNLLYLSASALLALMTLSGLASWLNLSRVKVELEPPPEIFAGLPALFRVHLRGPFWPCFFLRVRTPYGETLVPWFRGKRTVSLWLRFPRRGTGRLSFLELVSGYPLGFFRRTRFLESNLALTVYPRPQSGPLRIVALEVGEAGSSLSGSAETEPEDLVGLEPFREGTPASRIAWKASAARGELLVKLFRGSSGPRIVLDLRPPISEELVSRATEVVLRSLREGKSVGLKLPEREIPPGRGDDHRRILLEALAYV